MKLSASTTSLNVSGISTEPFISIATPPDETFRIVQTTVAPSNAINPAFSTRRLVEKRFCSIEVSLEQQGKYASKPLKISRIKSRKF
jgi:hypothetical protein